MNLTLPWTAREEKASNGARHRLEDVRQTLSQQASDIAHGAAGAADQAAQKVRDAAAAQGWKEPRDAVDSASGVAQQLLHGAAELGSQLAEATRKSMADIGKDTKAAADDLSQVRLTTEPERKVSFLPGVTLLGGFASGIALMYFFDPERGRRRRALLRDKLTKWMRITRETALAKAEDMRNRAQGAAIETRETVEETIADAQPSAPPPTENGYSSEFADVTHSGVGVSNPSAESWGG